ncbi:MAG: HepT-like ribonuclease domain-containing protein [Bacteroidales bacterium]
MNEKQLKFLYDIKIAIDEIDSYFETELRNFDNYKKNSLLKRAIERNLEIIGSRNQIIHGYDSISDENIWGIITNYLPKLKSEVNTMINITLHYTVGAID